LEGTTDRVAIAGLVDLLTDDDPYVVSAATRALEGTTDRVAIAGLVDVAVTDDDPALRLDAARACRRALSGTDATSHSRRCTIARVSTELEPA
jgi:HEAT repeat protein